MVIDKLPFDKYELEPSPLTQYILERKSPHMCWQVGHLFTQLFNLNSILHAIFHSPQTVELSFMVVDIMVLKEQKETVGV